MGQITVGSGDGWLTIADDNVPTNYMKVYFEQCTVRFHMKPEIKHFVAQGHYGNHLGEEWLEFTVQGIILSSHTYFSTFVDYIKDWQNASSMYIRIQYNSTPNYIEWDGDNTFFEVLLKDGIEEMECVSPWDEFFVIRQIKFEQIG